MRRVRYGLIAIAAIVFAFVSLERAGAQSTLSQGPNSPASVSDDSNATNGAGGTPWANQSSALIVDGTGATCAIPGSSGIATDLLVLNNFGFTLPSGSTIVGVSVTVTLKGSNNLIDLVVRLCTSAGTLAGTNQARISSSTWQTAYNAVTYGSSSSTWGTTLTASQVNSSGFGFEIGTQVIGSPGGTQTANVDGATMTITYTPPPPAGTRRIFPMTILTQTAAARTVLNAAGLRASTR